MTMMMMMIMMSGRGLSTLCERTCEYAYTRSMCIVVWTGVSATSTAVPARVRVWSRFSDHVCVCVCVCVALLASRYWLPVNITRVTQPADVQGPDLGMLVSCFVTRCPLTDWSFVVCSSVGYRQFVVSIRRHLVSVDRERIGNQDCLLYTSPSPRDS